MSSNSEYVYNDCNSPISVQGQFKELQTSWANGGVITVYPWQAGCFTISPHTSRRIFTGGSWSSIGWDYKSYATTNFRYC